jgi:hypothetical protein
MGVAGYQENMTYDPNTGFRNGSLAQRSPVAYFLALGAIYSAIWFGLSLLGHHHARIVADLIGSIVLGAVLAGIHLAVWRWRSRHHGGNAA